MSTGVENSRAGIRPGSYDAVVVGARVAGAATAMLLARYGHHVLMVDRSRYGSDTVSTHTLLRTGVLQLQKWGLLDQIEQADTPPIRTVTLGFGPELVPIELSNSHGVDSLYAPRRTLLDKVLVDAAVAEGVEFLDRCRATSLDVGSDGRVRGVTVQHKGQEETVSAKMVIGADGVYSRVADWVGARTYRSSPPTNSVHYAYYEGIDVDGVHFQFTPGLTSGLIPTNDNLVCVYGGWPAERDREFRSDPGTVFEERVVATHPEVARALAGARRVTPFRGTPGLPGFLRTPGGLGWALVGDAGYTKDPVSAHGMSAALRDAELCARAVDGVLRDPLSEMAQMARYRSTRDRLSIGMSDAAFELASYTWDGERASSLMRSISAHVQAECTVLAETTLLQHV